MANPIAYNPTTGEAMRLEAGAWVPTQTAKNDSNGEVVAFDGAEWQRVTDAPSKIGLAARGVNDVVASVVGLPGDAINWAGRKLGVYPEDSVSPIGSQQAKRGIDYVATLPGRAVDAIRQGSTAPLADDRTSVFEPRTTGEKAAYGIGQGVGQAATTLLPATALAGAGGMTGAVARTLATQPIPQLAAGAVGGAVSEVTGSPWAGVGAGIATGLGGSLIQNALAPVRQAPSLAASSLAQGPMLPSKFTPGGMYTDDALAAAITAPAAKITTADTMGADMIAKALIRDKVDPTDIAGQLRALGDDAMLADIGGRNVKGKALLIANAPGEGAEQLAAALAARKAGEGSRVEKVASSVVGGANRAAQTTDDLVKARALASEPLYEKALNAPAPSRAIQTRLNQFLDDPLGKQGLKQGERIQRLEAVAANKPYSPKDLAITGFTDAGDPILGGVPNWRTLNVVKKGIDDILEQYRDKASGRLVLDEYGRAIQQFQKSLLGVLDQANPEYAAARAAWAGPSQAKDAVAWGQRAITGAKDPYVVAKQYGAMTDAQKEFARVGVADLIRKTAGEAGVGSQAQRIFGDTRATLNNQMERLKIIFGDDFPKLEALAKQEAAYNQTLKTLAPSQTARILAEQSDNAGEMMRVARGAMQGNPTSIAELATALTGAARGRLGFGDEQVRTAGAKLLTARDAERDAAIMAIVEAMMKRQGAAPTGAGAARYALPQALGAVDQRR